MVTLAPVGQKVKSKRSPLHFVEQRGDNGHPPVVQPKLKSYLTDGLRDQIAAGGDIDWQPDKFEPVPAEDWTGAKLFEVSLPGQPISRIRADDEYSAKGRYNALNGIIASTQPHTITEITNDKRKKQTAKPFAESIDDI